MAQHLIILHLIVLASGIEEDINLKTCISLGYACVALTPIRHGSDVVPFGLCLSFSHSDEAGSDRRIAYSQRITNS